jgi:hypothetical protein
MSMSKTSTAARSSAVACSSPTSPRPQGLQDRLLARPDAEEARARVAARGPPCGQLLRREGAPGDRRRVRDLPDPLHVDAERAVAAGGDEPAGGGAGVAEGRAGGKVGLAVRAELEEQRLGGTAGVTGQDDSLCGPPSHEPGPVPVEDEAARAGPFLHRHQRERSGDGAGRDQSAKGRRRGQRRRVAESRSLRARRCGPVARPRSYSAWADPSQPSARWACPRGSMMRPRERPLASRVRATGTRDLTGALTEMLIAHHEVESRIYQ